LQAVKKDKDHRFNERTLNCTLALALLAWPFFHFSMLQFSTHYLAFLPLLLAW